MKILRKLGQYLVDQNSEKVAETEVLEPEVVGDYDVESLPGLLPDNYTNTTVMTDIKTASVSNSVNVGRRWNPIFSFPYDGEKNPGEMGVIKKYWLNYRGLRNRSWQAYLENDILQGIIHKYEEWVVGNGIRLQSQPIVKILENANIEVPDDQAQDIEIRFQLFKNSKVSTYNKEKTLNQLESSVFKNTIVGGDMLVVLHIENARVKVQVIDGEHVFTPAFTRESRNRFGSVEIRDGVELGPQGEHVAYHVWTKDGKFERIPAFGEGGVRMAYLVYGLEYRHDNVRGIPIDSGILESLKKMERYKEAAISGAEERAKIAYFFESTKDSTNENPMVNQMAKSLPLNRTIDGGADTHTATIDAITLANKFVATTGKQIFTLPNEMTIKAPSSDQEINFRDFFETNLLPICAAVGIPVEVALSKFENNFSSSRAAIKQWEHTVKVVRTNFALQFLKPIYDLWLIMEDVRGDINLPSLFTSLLLDADDTLFLAYTNAKFLGANVPHVDPVKEVDAIRKKLGKRFENVPLVTLQQAMEELGSGDFEQVMEILEREIEELPEEVNLDSAQPPAPGSPNLPVATGAGQ